MPSKAFKNKYANLTKEGWVHTQTFEDKIYLEKEGKVGYLYYTYNAPFHV